MTYNNMVEMFRRFTDNHFFLKTFIHGEQPEMTNEKLEEYPLLFLLYTGSQYADGTETFNFEVYILDLPLNKETRLENQTEVVSDCKQVAEDILADIKLGGQIFTFPDLVDVVNASILPAIDTTTNLLSGVILSLSIDIPWTSDSCFAPITGVVPTPFGQDIVNTDGVLLKHFTNFQPVAVLDDIEVNDVIDIFGTFPQPTRIVVNGSTIDLVGVHPTTGEMIIDTICPAANPATYRNSDNSFSQLIASGATFISDDITVTDVDSTTRSVPSNLGVVCEWKNLQIFNSVGTILSPLITSYPTGGQIIYTDFQIQEQGVQFGLTPAGNRINIVNADIEDVVTVGVQNQITLSLIDINNSDGVTLLSPSDLIGDKTLPDIPFTAIGEDDTIAAPTGIVIDGEIDNFSQNATTGVLTITPASGGVTPAGIAYPQISPFTSLIDATAAGNDSVALYKDGRYTGYKPTNPATIACLDPADESGTTLLENNIFGNKFTYTDLGGNPSSVGTVNPEDRIDWVDHDFGSLPRIVINHEHGYMVTVDRLQNGDKVNMSTDATLGDTWYNWLSFIASLELGGYDNWLPIIGIVSSPWARQVNQGETIYRKFFNNTERADNRINFITGESINATLPFFFNDHGALPILTAIATIPKAGGTGFLGGLSKFIAMRMLTEADITALTA